MVLVDTSVWVDHLRRASTRLAGLLNESEVLCHPFVIGELACGNLRNRDEVLELLGALPPIGRMENDEVMAFIAARRFHGKGIGFVDMHLLASCAVTGCPIWTADANLARCAARLGLRFD
jgi:predicted nucleic acid-binding protein